MRSNLLKISGILAISGLTLATLSPLAQARSVSSIRGADEKNFADPETRCNTAEMQALNKQAINQMLADVKQRNAEGSQAAKTYQTKLDLIWTAMLQPYCGYGSNGIRAVRKSFAKSVNRARAAFMGSSIVVDTTDSDGTSGSD
jgi:hypothetical protein